jgi:GTPase
MKAAFTAVIGRPSVGKSTLVNAICGHKVSIIAPSPQTTRNTIRGIFSSPQGQIVFLDTPGFHDSEKKMNRYLKDSAVGALNEIDLVLYVMDTTRPPGAEEQELMRILRSRADSTIVALNKCDARGSSTDELKQILRDELCPRSIVEISALEKQGIDELVSVILEASPEGEAYYPEEYYTDQEPTFRAAEIIREWAINRVQQELPHAIYVDIADMEEHEVTTAKGELKKKLWIRAFLVVERESQKGILVGKKGALISEIRKGARRELEEIFPYRVELDLRVKVNPKWRSKDRVLKNLLS